MTRLMLEKWLEPFDQNRMHISTLIHQILSYLKQTGGIPAADLYRALCQRGPFRHVSRSQFATLLRGLAGHELIEQTPRRELILGLLGERITASFAFYAAFRTTEEFVVRCGQEEIGKLPSDIIPPVKEHLLLAGKRWRVEEIIPTQKLVLVVLSPAGKVPPFQGLVAEIHTVVIREMKSVLMDSNEPPYLDSNSKLLLRAARQTARAVKLDKNDIICGKQRIQWFPWVGTRALLTLSLLAKSAKIPHETDRLSITYHLVSLEEFFAHLQNITRSKVDAIALARLIPVKATDKFDGFVPEQLLDEANARNRLEISGAVEACKTAINKARQFASRARAPASWPLKISLQKYESR